MRIRFLAMLVVFGFAAGCASPSGDVTGDGSATGATAAEAEEAGTAPSATKALPAEMPGPVPRALVALGDSFASGVGASGMTTACGRSFRGWTGILAAELGMDFVNLACSGATLRDTIEQVSDLPDDVDVVAITAGGNSLKFSQVVTLCLGGDCDAGWAAALENLSRIQPEVVELLELIHESRPEVSSIVLTLYPAPTKPGLTCDKITDEVGSLFAEGAVLLNTELLAAAEQVRAKGVPVVVVDPVEFAEHTLCTESPWFHDFSKGLLVMHLNDAGYAALADAALTEVLSSSR